MSAPDLPMLWEDNHVLVVVKPPGIPTQADRSGDPDMLTLLKAGIKARHQKPGNVFLGLVQRLDRPVGGVMVFARTSKAASRLSEQIRNRTFQKTYLARVHGCPEPAAATLEHFLLKDERTNTVRVVEEATPGAKRAVLSYRVESCAGGISRVRMDLKTGRPHQIRVQMAAIGSPLVGDHKYGSGAGNRTEDQIALWSHEISFTHPTQGGAMHFSARPPW
jgi:23S rRNA pseudouridine1911/1915/1917 synthase